MFEKKIIFIDIDGTLIDKNEFIPKSTKMAIVNARQKGHRIYLCTGRSKAEIPSFILDIGFHGIIGCSGSSIEDNGKVILEKCIPQDTLAWIMEWFERYNIDFYTVSNQRICASKGFANKAASFGEVKSMFPSMEYGNEEATKILKINFIIPDELSQNMINKVLGDQFNLDYWSLGEGKGNFCELSHKGISKKWAIEKLLKILGEKKSNTIGFGDGLTDKSMLEYCEIGVAMGNANEEIKELADYVTTDIWNNGIYKGFKKFGLL